MIDDNFRRDVAFIAHKNYNIGQFLGQSGLYRPFSASKPIYQPLPRPSTVHIGRYRLADADNVTQSCICRRG
ncbi:MAG: hypothetical protein IKJ78_06635 [Bacteroidales bacterium]|nr:hypothetical protein [Bacteroidales bacterium]